METVKKSLISAILAVALVFSAFSASVSAEGAVESENIAQTGVSEDYSLVASNEYNELYLDDSSGNIIVKNLDTGKLWYSCPPDVESDKNSVGIEKTNVRSPLTIEYIYKETATSSDKTVIEVTNIEDECVPADITVSDIENGVKVNFYIAYLEMSVTVEYQLDGANFKASIVYDELDEGEYVYVIAMKLLPAFGAASIGEQGYIVVPDGSGAVINFNNGTGASEYTANVYGDEIDTLSYVDTNKEKSIRMPVFGIVKNDSALLGVITEGDDSAAISAYSACAKKYGYNTVASKAVYRKDSQISMFINDFANNNIVNQWCKSADGDRYTVTYSFLGQEDASYSGLASAYQDYLIENNVLKKREKAPSMHLNIYESISKTTAFLGFKYQKQVSLTTYDQTVEILKNLKDFGVNNITAKLVGWSNNGINNKKLPTGIKYLSNLGGKRGFKKLVAFANEQEIDLSADVDFAYAQKISRKNALQSYFNKIIYKYLYRNSVYTERRETALMIPNADFLANTAGKYIGKYSSTGLSSASLSSLGNFSYINFTSKNPQSKKYVIDRVKNVLENYKDAGYSITLDDANAYTFAYADVITSAPMASSGNEMFDYDIPFYQMVLQGYITLTTESLTQSVDANKAFLWAVTTGTEPLYNTFFEDADILQESLYDYLYSSTFSWWGEGAAEKYNRYSELLTEIYDNKIASYTQISENVVKTEFDNGVKVYVNYGDKPITVDGKTINSQDYLWTGGNK